MTFQEITYPEDLTLDLSYVRQMLAGEIRTYQMEKRYMHSSGDLAWVLLSVSLVRDVNNLPLYFISQIQDINQHKYVESQLQNLVKKLERSNQELEEFASVASHDLISPLRKQQIFVDLLQQDYGAVLDAEGREYLERMTGLNLRMERLIRNLLAYARVTIHAKPFAPVALNEVIQEIIFELEPQIARVKAQIKVGELPVIKGDRSQIRQLLQNLLQNALKFHSPERTPEIEIYSPSPEQNPADNNFSQIVIADNGIGFESTQSEKIFTPFHRLHGYSKYEGTGLGLAICEKIVKRHQGKIIAESKPQQGAMFTIYLPSND